jgi:hypothetical protein
VCYEHIEPNAVLEPNAVHSFHKLKYTYFNQSNLYTCIYILARIRSLRALILARSLRSLFHYYHCYTYIYIYIYVYCYIFMFIVTNLVTVLIYRLSVSNSSTLCRISKA